MILNCSVHHLIDTCCTINIGKVEEECWNFLSSRRSVVIMSYSQVHYLSISLKDRQVSTVVIERACTFRNPETQEEFIIWVACCNTQTLFGIKETEEIVVVITCHTIIRGMIHSMNHLSFDERLQKISTFIVGSSFGRAIILFNRNHHGVVRSKRSTLKHLSTTFYLVIRILGSQDYTCVRRNYVLFTCRIGINLLERELHDTFIRIHCFSIYYENIYILRNLPSLNRTPGSEILILTSIENGTFIVYVLVNHVIEVTQLQLPVLRDGVVVVGDRDIITMTIINIIGIEVETYSPATSRTVPDDIPFFVWIRSILSIVHLVRIVRSCCMTFAITSITYLCLFVVIGIRILVPVDILIVVANKSKLWFTIISDCCHERHLIALLCFIVCHIGCCRCIIPRAIGLECTRNSVTYHRYRGKFHTSILNNHLTTNTKVLISFCLIIITFRRVILNGSRTLLSRSWLHWSFVRRELIMIGIKSITSVTQQEQLISGRTSNSVAIRRKGAIFSFCVRNITIRFVLTHYVIGYNVIWMSSREIDRSKEFITKLLRVFLVCIV